MKIIIYFIGMLISGIGIGMLVNGISLIIESLK